MIMDPIDHSARFRKLYPQSVITGTLFLLALQTGGCALMAKPPTDSLAKAELYLRRAVEARADELAPMELQRAREKLEAARKAVAARRYDAARRLAEVAEVEAELAEAKADAELARRAADSLRKARVALRQELERSALGAFKERTGGSP